MFLLSRGNPDTGREPTHREEREPSEKKSLTGLSSAQKRNDVAAEILRLTPGAGERLRESGCDIGYLVVVHYLFLGDKRCKSKSDAGPVLSFA